MGLDSTFYATKRSCFKNFEVNILDENGDNIYKEDRPVFYKRNDWNIPKFFSDTSPDSCAIQVLKEELPKLHTLTGDKELIDVLNKYFDSGYIIYVESNW